MSTPQETAVGVPGTDGQLIEKLIKGKDVSEEQQKAVPGQNELSIVRRRFRSNAEGGIPISPMHAYVPREYHRKL